MADIQGGFAPDSEAPIQPVTHCASKRDMGETRRNGSRKIHGSKYRLRDHLHSIPAAKTDLSWGNLTLLVLPISINILLPIPVLGNKGDKN